MSSDMFFRMTCIRWSVSALEVSVWGGSGRLLGESGMSVPLPTTAAWRPSPASAEKPAPPTPHLCSISHIICGGEHPPSLTLGKDVVWWQDASPASPAALRWRLELDRAVTGPDGIRTWP